MEEQLFEDVHNYTKFKLIEMFIKKYKDINLDSLDTIEKMSDDVLRTLAICGMRYHQELKGKFEEGD